MTHGDQTSRPLRVAVLDTDSGFLQVLTKRMEALDWRFRIHGGPIPAEALVTARIDALVIDLAVLGEAAWSFLTTVSGRLPGLGIVVCTGRSSVAQRVRGLRVGADDWLTKPCHPEELVARVEAVVRRRRVTDGGDRSEPVLAGELEIRPDQFQAFVGGAGIDLTRREFELIHVLAAVQGQVMQREDLYERVWGYTMAHGDRSVDVFVRKLRQKLERASPDWRYIHTHFGVGYRFDPEPAEGAMPVAAAAEAVTAEAAASAPAAEPLTAAT